MEMQANQKNKLFTLLTLKAKNPGLDINGLEDFIDEAIAGMSQEDVAWVEKIVYKKRAEAQK